MKNLFGLVFLFFSIPSFSQEFSSEPTIGIYSGMVNYEGDLKPNSFTFGHSRPFVSFFTRIPISRWVTWKSGISFASVEAADSYNRTYLQVRNLSFYSKVQEAYTGIEIPILNIEKNRFTPFLFGGIAIFHFNPWTYDENNQKVYLQPLTTEGQGLSDYPDRKPYKLTQAALCFGVGSRFALNDNLIVGIEFNQRKTFTDYLDDVSSTYVDYSKLLAAKGSESIALAYRGDELPNGPGYPKDGDQRGTPTEKDWYYFLGFTVELKFDVFKSLFGFNKNGKDWYSQKCPTRF